MKNILLAVLALIAVIGVLFYVISSRNDNDLDYNKPTTEVPTAPTATSTATSTATTTPVTEVDEKREAVATIGKSVSGTDIKAYHFGEGDRELLLIGGLHGGYSWNTAALAYELIDWLKKNPTVIPEGVSVTVIPVLNPDGLSEVTSATSTFAAKDVKGTLAERTDSRFNQNNVDLNRNFDCEWKASGTWQSKTVSGGSAPFSEPETKALRDYVTKYEPSAVVAWYSAAGGVYASRCGDTTMPATLTLMNKFAAAAKYTAYEEFDYYEITGDMVNWFAKEEIPAISVLLTTHEATELTKNQAGVTALLEGLSR